MPFASSALGFIVALAIPSGLLAVDLWRYPVVGRMVREALYPNLVLAGTALITAEVMYLIVLYVASAARLHVLGEQLPDWAAGITAGALSSLVPRAIQLRRTVIRGWHPGTERESLYDKLLRIYVVAAYRNYIKKAPWTDIRNAIIIGVSAVYSAYELADEYIRMTEARPLTEPERGWLREVIDSRALSSARKARVVAIRVAQEDRATALRLAARRAPAIVALRAHMALGFQPPEPTRPKAQDKTKSAGSPT